MAVHQQKSRKAGHPAVLRKQTLRDSKLKLRQREEKEINELKARIEIEMPLSGLTWTPPAVLSFIHPQQQQAQQQQAQEHLQQHDQQQQQLHTSGFFKKVAKPEVSAPSETDGIATTELEEDAAAAASTTPVHSAAAVAALAAAGGPEAPTLSRFYFADLPLSNHTQKGLREAGYVLLSQIQLKAIPHALRGADVMGEAKTGSGKTLAFLVPLLECLYRHRVSSLSGVAALILAPTRELAIQTYNVVKLVSKFHDFTSGCLIGGKDMNKEAAWVNRLNIVVGTPGRVLQHAEESALWDTSDLKVLVIDEADRLADMGFLETVKHIIESLPFDRQTLFFSATLRSAVNRLAAFASRPEAERITLADAEVAAAGAANNTSNSATPLTLKQSYLIVPPQYKLSALFSLLRTHSNKKILVFVSSCKQARFVAEAFRLLKPGPKMLFLHGRQKQARRLEVMHAFVQREAGCCLVSTDLASRGIDFAQLRCAMEERPTRAANSFSSSGKASSGKKKNKKFHAAAAAVDFVVQLDCPDSVETYIHRVGRTARMQRSGHSLLLLLSSERAMLSRLRARKIEPKELFINPQRAVKIEHKLQALLASNTAMKNLAQQALSCYLRCVALMPDKEVFRLPTEKRVLTQYANAYGLSLPPTVTQLDLSSSNSSASTHSSYSDSTTTSSTPKGCVNEATEDDVRLFGGAVAESDLKKNKNKTKLERLKEKIRQKKLQKLARGRGVEISNAAGSKTTTKETLTAAMPALTRVGVNEGFGIEIEAGVGESSNSSSVDSRKDEMSKNDTVIFEAKAVTVPGGVITAAQQEPSEMHTESDDFLFIRKEQTAAGVGVTDMASSATTAEDSRRLLHEQLLRKPAYQRERLRFKADGTAKIKGLAAVSSLQQDKHHIIFGAEDTEDEDDVEKPYTSQEATSDVLFSSSKKAETPNSASSNSSSSNRDVFLAKMRAQVQERREIDRARDRIRVREVHAHKRLRKRAQRRPEAADRQGCTAAAAYSRSGEDATSQSFSVHAEEYSNVCSNGPRKESLVGNLDRRNSNQVQLYIRPNGQNTTTGAFSDLLLRNNDVTPKSSKRKSLPLIGSAKDRKGVTNNNCSNTIKKLSYYGAFASNGEVKQQQQKRKGSTEGTADSRKADILGKGGSKKQKLYAAQQQHQERGAVAVAAALGKQTHEEAATANKNSVFRGGNALFTGEKNVSRDNKEAFENEGLLEELALQVLRQN